MRRPSLLLGVLFGLLTSVPVTVVLYFGQQVAALAFVPFNLFDFLTRVLPGAVLSFGIDLMVRIITDLHLGSTSQTAKFAEQSMAVILFVLIGALIGLILAAAGGRREQVQRLPRLGLGIGLVLVVAFLLIQIYLGIAVPGLIANAVWLAVLIGGWGLVLGWLLRESAIARAQATASGLSRREVLYLAGSAAVALIAGAVGLGFLFARQKPQEAVAPTAITPLSPLTSGEAASPPQSALAARVQPAPGTRAEIQSNADFYRVNINTVPPRVDATGWRLEVSGLVDHPLTLTLDEIRARAAVSQYITLSCISNPIGGDLISTALITGLRLKDLMQEAGLHPEVKALAVQSADGFFESVVLDDMMDERTLLVYEMNEEPLPVAHGFPLRLYIPNRYGMKQPKWIMRLEAIDNDGSGYWEERGWSNQAIVRTTSVIDNVAVGQPDPGSGNLPIGGIAYSGARGIGKVEVQVDNGPWVAAELRDPPLSPLTWVQWRYDWRPQPGQHLARVRAYDENGTLQIVESGPTYPDGATGIDTFSFRV
jgi:DMSO/TMAO reductase YedYZ molybdopterin-dependent catalytic subunit